MESQSAAGPLLFSLLQRRLLEVVNERIANGEFTERGFARFLGISQPQIHNILKGARKLSPETADLILTRLNLSVLDLLTESETGALPAGSETPVRRPPALERSLRKPFRTGIS